MYIYIYGTAWAFSQAVDVEAEEFLQECLDHRCVDPDRVTGNVEAFLAEEYAADHLGWKSRTWMTPMSAGFVLPMIRIVRVLISIFVLWSLRLQILKTARVGFLFSMKNSSFGRRSSPLGSIIPVWGGNSGSGVWT